LKLVNPTTLSQQTLRIESWSLACALHASYEKHSKLVAKACGRAWQGLVTRQKDIWKAGAGLKEQLL
jgi:hypothetical protein